jgi:hypothetical protein
MSTQMEQVSHRVAVILRADARGIYWEARCPPCGWRSGQKATAIIARKAGRDHREGAR